MAMTRSGKVKKVRQRRPDPRGGWDDRYYVLCHRLARDGYDDTKIADACGAPHRTFVRWKSQDPALREALESGRLHAGVRQFEDYAYGRLPARLKAVWDRLEAAEDTTSEEFLDRCMAGCTLRDRQRVWLHALISSNFNYNRACLKTGINPSMPYEWGASDPDFLSMVDEVRLARKDWIEGGLMDLVARRDVSAVIFANKTQNADRGYNPAKKLEAEIVRRDEIDVNVFIAELPPEVIPAVMAAMDKARAPHLPPKDVTDG